MKAIQIFEVNKKLLEQWGEKEELTWANSFGDLIGSALVVDEALPQGYAVKTASDFCREYVWVSNFGTEGWSDIRRNSDGYAEPKLEVSNVGKSLSKSFLSEMSLAIGLPANVCEALLKAGWTLEISRTHPAKWTQSLPALKIEI